MNQRYVPITPQIVASCLLVCLMAPAPIVDHARAYEDEQPPAVTNGLNIEFIQGHMQAVQGAKDLDDETRTKALDIYKRVLAELELAKNWDSQAADFAARTAGTPDKLQATKNELAALSENGSVLIPADATLAQLEQTLQQKGAEAAQLRKQLAGFEDEPKRRADRRVEIPKLLAALRERLGEVDKEIAAPPPAQETAMLVAARRALLDARQMSIKAEIAVIEKELALYDAGVELLPLVRDAAKRRVKIAEQEAKAWEAAVAEVREREVAQQSKRAELVLDQVPDELRPLAQENVAFAEERKRIDVTLKETRGQLDESNEQLQSLGEQYKRVVAQEKAIGLTGALGMLLRKQRLSLPNWRGLRRESNERQSQIGDLQVRLLELQDLRSEMADVEERLEVLLKEQFDAPQAIASETEAAARQLVVARREYLDGLLVDNNTWFETLVSLDSAQQELIVLAEQYEAYIDERVLWSRSANHISAADLPAGTEAALWLTYPKRWMQVGDGLVDDLLDNPLPPLLAIVIFVPLVVYRLRLRRIIRASGEEAESLACQSYVPTIRALVCSALASALWPGILLYVGWRLGALSESIELAQPLSAGLLTAVAVYFPLEAWRQISRRLGLAQSHFGCSDMSLRSLRRHLRWLVPSIVPLVVLVVMIHTIENPRWESSLGRATFIVALLLVAFFVKRVLSPTGGVLREIIATHRGGWLDRLQVIWYPLAILVPLFLAGLAATGYFYTAGQLALRLQSTTTLILTLLLASGLLLRWVFVNQRRVAAEQAQMRIEQAAVAAIDSDQSSQGATSQLAATTPAEGEMVDLLKLDLQTRRLVRSFGLLAGIFGAWLIWNDVIPALGMLQRVRLWDTTVQVARTVTLADGTSSLESITSVEPITLSHLAMSLLIVLMAFVAVKNIPGLLELAILRHLPMDPALRFAFTTVTRYALIVIGLMWSLSTIGWGWSKIQWLVAAVSVGLGFGLQEIFANFVSGLILLFERPLRAGDIVTVGDVSGKVTQIRTRATVIQDWDRKELIVPNKEFITGRLLNWTLSDPVNRIVVQVGVAYGSDIAKTRELIMTAATDHPLILAEPAPSVTFDLFGESSLNFTLRAFLPNLENRLAVIHEVHATIQQEMAAAGIEIAFPQRDLHLRSIVPLEMARHDAPSNGSQRPLKQSA